MVEVLDYDIAILEDSLDSKSSFTGTFNRDVGFGREALLLLSAIKLIIQFLAVGWGNAVLRCNADVAVLCPSLVDSTLGIGSAGLSI